MEGLKHFGPFLGFKLLSLFISNGLNEGFPAYGECIFIDGVHGSNKLIPLLLQSTIYLQTNGLHSKSLSTNKFVSATNLLSCTYIIKLKMKILLLVSLLAVLLALKPSEAGINDWHLNNVGEIRSISFAKNKVQYVSFLNQIGVIDKLSGKIQTRFAAPQAQKVVNWGEKDITVATRHNQIITYSFKPNGIDHLANNNFLGEAKKIESFTKVGKNEYFLTSTTFSEDKSLIRQAKGEEEFLKITSGVGSDSLQVVFLAYRSGSQVCVQNYKSFNFYNLYCVENHNKKIDQLIFQQYILVLSLGGLTFILNEDLQFIHEVNESLIELSSNTAVFKNQLFDCLSRTVTQRRPVWSNRDEAKISLEQSKTHIQIFNDGMEVLKIFHNTTRTKVLRAWFNYKSELEFDIIIQFSDLQLVCYSSARGALTVNWKKEESLGYIEDVIFLKYNKLDTLDNPYHRHLISHSYRGKSLFQKLGMVPQDIMLRFSEQLTDIISHAASIVSYISENIASIDIQSIRKFQMSKQQQFKYGLRKYLIVATKYNTLIAIDTKTKDILWKINHNDNQYVSLTVLKRDYETENAIFITYSESKQQIVVEQILQNGEIVSLSAFNANIAPLSYKLNEHSILLKVGNQVQKFDLVENDDLAEKQYYFYSHENNEIDGWKIIDNKVVKIWNFQSKSNEKILKTASAFRGDQNSHIPLYDREKVFFKNVDFTNIAVLTNTNQTNIGLYVINGRTGKVQYNAYKTNVNNGLPVNLVYDENNVLVSYYHLRNKYYQIWTIEQYQQRIQSSAIAMISDYLNNAEYKPQENREQTIFESEVYSSPVAIKEMYVSESKMSLTRRNIFIITRENKLYTINRDFVNTRRPRKDVKQAKGFFSNQKLPEHNYILPFSPASYLSYDIPLANIKQVRFSPTDMESSIFVFCYGVDNFLIRTAPDKTFDMITQDFNYLILLLILIVGTVVILVFKRQVNLAKLKKPHLQ